MADPKFKVGDVLYSEINSNLREVKAVGIDQYTLKVITPGVYFYGEIQYQNIGTVEYIYKLQSISLEDFVNAKLKANGYA